jgi:threonine/homoserine/homoserine lactone efflux protein
MWVDTFWEGVLAGYGIAIPVGAVAILIVEQGIRRGLSPALLAGAGAATADFVYASLAAWLGAAVAEALAPYALILRWLSAIALLVIGVLGIVRSFRDRSPDQENRLNQEGHPYMRFLLLTLVNPLTVAYFTALILGRSGSVPFDAPERLAFMFGAGISSLSWQSLLALVGALAHRHLSPRIRSATAVLGNGLVMAFGFRILLSLLAT